MRMLGKIRTVKTCGFPRCGMCDQQSKHDDPGHKRSMKLKEKSAWVKEWL